MARNAYPKASQLLPCLEVGDSSIAGKGVFTTESIQLGTVVIVWGGEVYTQDEVDRGVSLGHTHVGIGEDLYLAVPAQDEMSLDDYMNHSCDPNLWLADEVTLVARRDIAANEELTIDYAMELGDERYVMKAPCSCGSSVCRTIVTGKDWRLPTVQLAYSGHFSPFINERIRRLNTAGADAESGE